MKNSKKIAACLIFLLLFSGNFSNSRVFALTETLAPSLDYQEPSLAPETQGDDLQPQTSIPHSLAGDLKDAIGFLDELPITPAKTETAEVFIDEDLLKSVSYKDVTALSSDTYYGTFPMWGFDRVNAQKAWTLSRGAGITIAVIDTGLDSTHEDILGNIYTNTVELNGLPGVDDDGDGLIDDIHGWDFVNNDNNPLDDNGHGTHVSGIAAAVADNNKGIAGIAPDAKIIPVKVLDAGGSGTIANVIKGIRYAADLGARVINMSLGIAKRYLSSTLLAAFQDAVNYAVGKGSVVITAAGNEKVDSATTAPAGLDNTIAVGAIDSSRKIASFSNKNPDIVAPGVSIGSLYTGGRYVYLSGTSMASPYVAGAAALILSYHRTAYQNLAYTGQQIYNDVLTRLTKSASDLGSKGYDSNFGYGLLDAFKALTVSTGISVNPKSTSKSSFAGMGVQQLLGAGASLTGVRVASAGTLSGNFSVPASVMHTGFRIGAFYQTYPKKKKKKSSAENFSWIPVESHAG